MIDLLQFGMPIISTNCRYGRAVQREPFRIVASRTAGPQTIAAAEQEPWVRNTKWHFGELHVDRVLSMPRMMFFITLYRGVFESTHAFFLKSAFVGHQTALYNSILPNTSYDGWICMGDTQTQDNLSQATLNALSLESKVDAVLASFWRDTHFNDHLLERFTTYPPKLHPSLATLATWERASRTNPDFILDVPWEFAETAGSVFERLRRDA